ncbi:MAG: fructosamine kinase family protein [Flavobacteriales bacterium]|nr:fructosamine kinase family protein [Flavobacteriales bacterium]
MIRTTPNSFQPEGRTFEPHKVDMTPSKGTITEVEVVLSEKHGLQVTVRNSFPLTGGSINDAYRLETSKGEFFLKVNSADGFPSMFAAEVDGLERLSATKTLRTPTVIGHGETDDTTWLLLEFVGEGKRNPSFWHHFGKGLAQLHSNAHAQFGLERNNYIGSLEQINTQEKEWSTFFIQQRLEPLVKLARDKKRVEAGLAFRFERLYGKLNDLFPKEPPALLHGDLWHGNFICDPESKPVLIDPAVYFGHREMDIAMLHLFGSIDPDLIVGYTSEKPLEKEWEKRMELCNLYPLMVHVNLFGGHYVQEVEKALGHWV